MGKLVSVREISNAYSISQNHLVKVAHRLSQLGYLKSTRGRSGGIALRLAPGRRMQHLVDIRIAQALALVHAAG